MLERIKKYVAVGLATILLLLGLRSCLHREPPPTLPQATSPLLPNEVARIVVTDNKVTVVTPKGTKSDYVPSGGNAVITVNKSGVVDIKRKDFGFGFKLGGGIAYADTARVTLDAQFVYWNRLSLLGGIAVSHRPIIVPWVGIGYKLDQIHLDNTSIFVGIAPHGNGIVGIRVEL